MLESNHGTLEPFIRAKLFVSIYEACKHLNEPEMNADSITDTIISKLDTSTPIIKRRELIQAVQTTLQAFNKAAAVSYSAFHPI